MAFAFAMGMNVPRRALAARWSEKVRVPMGFSWSLHGIDKEQRAMRSNSEFEVVRRQNVIHNPSRCEIRSEMSRIRSAWTAEERNQRRHMAQVSQWLLLLPDAGLLAG
jgi:hypothetical protein